MELTPWICMTCGVQFEPAERPSADCPICSDERQYVRPGGQAWTTLAELQAKHRNLVEQEEPGLWSIRTEPAFAIGQRAFLVQTDDGNLLWDAVSLVDDATVQRLRELGGVRAIAISHPHYYSSMAAWSEAFDNAPIWIHEADRSWVMRPSANVTYWSGAQQALFGGVSLVCCAGHFDGYQVAHWLSGAGGAGVLLAGDQPQVCLDRKWVTFMYSYPNWIPLNASAVNRITSRLEGLRFDRLYSAFGRHLSSGAKETIARSKERYLKAIAD